MQISKVYNRLKTGFQVYRRLGGDHSTCRQFFKMSDSDLDLDDRELTKSPDKSIEALRSAAEPTKRKGNSEQDRAPEVSNADLFSLMTTYFNNKLSGIEKNFSDTTETLVKRAKKAENTFKFKGNQLQFELNSDIQDSISTAIGYIEKNRPKKAVRVLEDSSVQLKKRNKLIRIADKSEGGWRTVNEYLSDEVASDSEDEKRIRAADNRAVKKIKAEKTDKRSSRKRPAEASGSTAQMAHNGTGSSDATFRLQPFRGGLAASGQSFGNQNSFKTSDVCYNCGMQGHWARDCRKGKARTGPPRGSSS